MKNGITVAVCLDKEGGMIFNNRRQSKDRVMLAELLDSFPDRKILISPFSEKLFLKYPDRVLVVPSPLDAAKDGDICFIENLPLGKYADKISRLVIYHWNRLYPWDMKIDIDPAEIGLGRILRTDFVGSSHDKITKEIYER